MSAGGLYVGDAKKGKHLVENACLMPVAEYCAPHAGNGRVNAKRGRTRK